MQSGDAKQASPLLLWRRSGSEKTFFIKPKEAAGEREGALCFVLKDY